MKPEVQSLESKVQGLPASELETCFECGRSKGSPKDDWDGGTLDLMAMLGRHEDARRVTPESEHKGRVKGCQGVILYPSGKVTVVWHWGCRPFFSFGEMFAFYSGGGR